MTDLLILEQEENNDYICKCGGDGAGLHTCPFAEEIHDDHESLCNCCEECTENCAMDI